jgi:hypothetical protein
LFRVCRNVLDASQQHWYVSDTAGSRLATVRFTTFHFYNPCRVRPSTSDLWCITVATQVSVLYLLHFSFPVFMSFFLFYFSVVLLSWLWFFLPWFLSKRQKRRKFKTVDVKFFLDVFWTVAWSFNTIKSDLIDFLNYLCNFLYT